MLPSIAVLALVFVGLQAASEDECLNRRPVSVSERVIAADVVLSGTIRLLYQSKDKEEYAADIYVHWIYKGQTAFPDDFDSPTLVPSDVFVTGFGREATCRNEVELGETKMFFLKIGDDDRLTLNYYWTDDGRFADGTGSIKSNNLEQAITTVDETKNLCKKSPFGCCSDGVTARKEDGSCTERKVNIADPVLDNRVEPVEGPIDLLDRLGFRNLPDGIEIVNDSSCPDVSRMSFSVNSNAVINGHVATVFDNWNEFPKEFLVFIRSKQGIDEESYLMALNQSKRHAFALRFQRTTVEFEYIDIYNSSQSVAFDVDVTDNNYHRLVLEVQATSVSLYEDCTLIRRHGIQRKIVPFEGQLIIGRGEPGKSQYHGVLEVLKISSEVDDFEKVCETHLPECPDPPPPTSGPTTPSPTSVPTTSTPIVIPSTPGISPTDMDIVCEDGLHCFYGSCTSMDGRCECPMCDNMEPVSLMCGNDGVTYGSLCSLKRTSCVNNRSISLIAEGPCKPDDPTIVTSHPTDDGPSTECDEENCQFGGSCEETSDGNLECVCDFLCTAEYRPVCGSDGMTHSNNCTMLLASCENQTDIRRVKDGKCAKLCMGGEEPVRKDEGHFYLCHIDGDCPPESACDISAGLCCPVVMPAPTTGIPVFFLDCSDTTFGCCKDGVTEKGGDGDKGCPGEVDFTLQLSKAYGVQEAEAFCPNQRTNATAYSVIPTSFVFVETTNIFPVKFPKFFSVLMTIRLSGSVNGSIWTVLRESSDVDISVSAKGDRIVIEYAVGEGLWESLTLPGQLLNDGKYHRIGLSFQDGKVQMYVDCEPVGTKRLYRDQKLPFDSMGYIIINGRVNCSSCGLEGDIDQLSIIPDPDAARRQCGELLYCPTSPPPVKTSPTTAKITTQPTTVTTRPTAIKITTEPTKATTNPQTTSVTLTSTQPSTSMPSPSSSSGASDPGASFSGRNSYLQLRPLNITHSFVLKLDFIATGRDGVLFYGDDPRSGMFIALSSEERQVHLRMNDGENEISLVSEGKKLKKDEWFTVEVSAKKTSVSLYVTDRKRARRDKDKSEKDFKFTNVYVGGIRSEFESIASARVVSNFQGCIKSLQLNDIYLGLDLVIDIKRVSLCGTVAPTSIATSSQEATTAAATTAEPTTAEPTTAEPTTAEPTTAEPTTTPTSLPSRPFFSGAGSFLAFTSPAAARSFELEISFTVSRNDGLIFYVGNTESGDYVSVSYESRLVKVKVNRDSQPIEIVPKGKKLTAGSWTLNLNIKKEDIILHISDRPRSKTTLTSSGKFEFGGENMYVGGLPTNFTLVPGSEQASGVSAFEGCVSSVSVNTEVLDLTDPVMWHSVTACSLDPGTPDVS